MSNHNVLNRKLNHHADFVGVLKTCRRSMTDGEVDLVLDNFNPLFSEQLEKGHTSDVTCDNLGFPTDKNSVGDVTERKAGTSQEWMQRAKCPSHEEQKSQRKEREEIAFNEKQKRQIEKKCENATIACSQSKVYDESL